MTQKFLKSSSVPNYQSWFLTRTSRWFTLPAALLILGQSECPDEDADADDWTTQEGDCDDHDANIHPGSDELCDGVDGNCDGSTLGETDADGDGILDCNEDSDGDGLTDSYEQYGMSTGFVTDANNADTDGDGVSDSTDAAPIHFACATTLYFWDDFSTDPSDTWSVVKGTWTWDPDALTYANTNSDAGNVSWIGSQSWTDYVFEAKVRPGASSNDAGLLFRAQSVSSTNNGGNQYYVGLYPSGDSITLGYMNGGWNPLVNGSVGIDNGTSYAVRVEAFGTSLSVYVNDKATVTTTDSHYAPGSIGLRSYQLPATYDSVIVCD